MPDPAKALQMLDLLEEFFDGGRRWTRGVMHDSRGNRCMLGALATYTQCSEDQRRRSRILS